MIGRTAPSRALRQSLALAFALVVCALAPRAAGAGYYDKIRPGEGLDALAARNQVALDSLRSANKLGANAQPGAGTMIYVPRARPPAPAPQLRTSTAQPSDVYVVEKGDTLIGIARKKGMTTEELARANAISSSTKLSLGQRLRLPPKRSLPAAAPGAPTQKPGADTTTSQSPASRTRPQDQPIYGGHEVPAMDIPGGGIQVARPSRRGFIWPVEGRVLRRYTNNSRERQLGVDIGAALGTPVRAARDGRVVYAGSTVAGYGRMAVVEHGGGLATCYAHAQRLSVREGDRVRQGQVIAEVGDTARGPEPLLHFEVRRNGSAVDPEEYLP